MNKKRNRFITFIYLLLFFSAAFAEDFAHKSIKLKNLSKNWELFLYKSPEETFKLIEKNIPADFTVTIPNEWNKEIARAGGTIPEAFGCYRYLCENLDPNVKYALHTKESPGTSCAVYVNQKKIEQIGDPYALISENFNQNPKRYGPSHSKSTPMYCEFTTDENGTADIVIFVSNYYYRKGGLWDSVYLGDATTIWRYNILSLVFYCIVIGSLLFTGLLNMVQFAFNKKRTSYFFLGLASLAFAIRIATAGYCSLSIFLPSLTAELKIKLEMIAIWVVPISVLELIFLQYPSNKRTVVFKFLKEKYLRYTLIGIALISGIISLVLPAWYTNRMVPYMQILMIIFCVYVVVFSTLNLFKRKRYSLYNFLSYTVIVIGGVIDIIHNEAKETIPIPTLPFFILAFVIFQIIMLAAIQNDIYKETVKGSDNLKRLNDAYLRFVPKEFLRLLNKDSIIKTKLGDYSNIEMTIMFSKVDISCSNPDFSLEDNFTIFNEYLKTISPVIKKYDGFVSKFLSGGFMALFPNSGLDAIRTALEIKDSINKLNDTEQWKDYTITPWMGIHFGKMIIGTIGEENRLDDTVISDTVNTAARIESVCEKTDRNIIISEAIYKRIISDLPEKIQLDALEVIYVKGKEKPLQLYEASRKKQAGTQTLESEAK